MADDFVGYYDEIQNRSLDKWYAITGTKTLEGIQAYIDNINSEGTSIGEMNDFRNKLYNLTEVKDYNIKDGKILLTSKFNVLLEDYNIRVPSNFVKKINREIEISVNALLEPYER